MAAGFQVNRALAMLVAVSISLFAATWLISPSDVPNPDKLRERGDLADIDQTNAQSHSGDAEHLGGAAQRVDDERTSGAGTPGRVDRPTGAQDQTQQDSQLQQSQQYDSDTETAAEQPPTPQPGAGRLSIEISGIEPQAGTIRVAIFRPGDQFPDVESASELTSVAAPDAKQVTVDFHLLPPGKYAVAVYQDKNDDGVLNKARIGLPLERYGFSNNARRVMGPPSYEAAAFELGAEPVVQTITLK